MDQTESNERRIEREEEEEEEDEEEILKKRISSHPLYGLLVEHHMDCLKIGSMGADQNDGKKKKKKTKKNVAGEIPSSSSFSQPELDRFMEAYCLALSKLKAAMEKPQEATIAFMNSMHLQLLELTETYPEAAESSTTPHPLEE